MIRKLVAAAALSLPLSVLAVGPADATQNHEDPCPGQHVQVYNENSFVVLPHFVCAGDLQGPVGPKGDTGATGPKGDTGESGKDGRDGADGEASRIPGPQGPDGAVGPVGPAGAAGLDSIVAGPVGPAGPAGLNGKDGQDGKSNVGPRGPRGPKGDSTILHPDGTVDEVPGELPETGVDMTGWLIFSGGLALLSTGVWLVTGRRK